MGGHNVSDISADSQLPMAPLFALPMLSPMNPLGSDEMVDDDTDPSTSEPAPIPSRLPCADPTGFGARTVPQTPGVDKRPSVRDSLMTPLPPFVDSSVGA